MTPWGRGPPLHRLRIADLLEERGPVFVDLKVEKGGDYEYRWDLVHGPESRRAFREALDNA